MGHSCNMCSILLLERKVNPLVDLFVNIIKIYLIYFVFLETTLKNMGNTGKADADG